MHCYLIHTSVNRSHDLTGSAVGILITCQQISQIIMPEITEEELMLEANKWELSHGGMSGRAAQQFVDYLLGTRL